MADPLPNYRLPPPGAIPAPNPAGYPVQGGTTQQGSTGGLVNVAGGVQAGVQNGLNMVNQGMQMDRSAQEWKEQQAANASMKAAASPGGVDPAAAHQGFLSTLANSPAGSAVMAGVHAIGNFISGGHTPPTQAIPTPQGPPAPAPAAPAADQGPPAPAPAPVAPPVADSGPPPMMNGGPVTPAAASFGVQPAFVGGLPGFANGGAIPDPAASVQAGVANGQDMTQQGVQDAQANTTFNQDQASRGASAAAASPPPADPQSTFVKTTNALMQDMTDHSHDQNDTLIKDRGVATPNANAPIDPAAPAPAPTPSAGSPGVPTPPGSPPAVDPTQAKATAAVVQDLAQNPPPAPGTPGPVQKSLSPIDWDRWDAMKEKAVQAAAAAGHDPGQVRAALDANQNAFIQGHVLRYLSIANTAQLSGDTKGVEAAMKNAYYYMPDGKELVTQKDANGNLVYQDPIKPVVTNADGTPVLGKDGKPQPNMIPVDAAHIQMLGTAMLDPMNVQTTIQNVRMAAATAQKEYMTGQGAYMTGQGSLAKGQGILDEGKAKLSEVNSTNYKNIGTTDADLMRSRAIATHLTNIMKNQPNMDPEIQKTAFSASDGFSKLAAGEYGTVPTQIPDTRPGHQGEMVPNPDPNAGKPMRDPTKIPAELKTLTPSQVMEGAAVAGEITIANRGKSAAEAMRLAALYASGKTKKEGVIGGKGGQANVQTDPNTGDTHVWNKSMKKWEAFKMPLASASDAATGGTVGPADPVATASIAGSGAGQQGIPGSPSDLDNARSEPDMTSPS